MGICRRWSGAAGQACADRGGTKHFENEGSRRLLRLHCTAARLLGSAQFYHKITPLLLFDTDVTFLLRLIHNTKAAEAPTSSCLAHFSSSHALLLSASSLPRLILRSPLRCSSIWRWAASLQASYANGHHADLLVVCAMILEPSHSDAQAVSPSASSATMSPRPQRTSVPSVSHTHASASPCILAEFVNSSGTGEKGFGYQGSG